MREPELPRHRIGILFNFSPSWMGGIIYIINIIKTLNFLDDEEKPEIILFYRPELRKFAVEIKYPYLSLLEWRFPSVTVGYLVSMISGRNLFVNTILVKHRLDAIFPLLDYPVRTKSKTKLVSWYADLQHEYYPEFFTKLKILERTIRIKLLLKNTNDLVVSSRAVANDFSRFYNPRKDMKLHVFHFVSIIDGLEEISTEDLKIKYHLPDKYFLVSNQFYKHKNHKVLLLALGILKAKGVFINLAVTGKLPDNIHSPYISDLYKIIDKHQLQSQISFLGVIPRAHQLILMRNSQAVIQPSLFEGWSTVIEDARSLQVPVVASNIPVNIEQLGEEGAFFDPNTPEDLAGLISSFPERNLNDVFYEEYSVRVKKAAKVFIDIIS